jgi:hypothetical protein
MVNIARLTPRQKPEKSAKFSKKSECAKKAREQNTTKPRAKMHGA